MTNQLFNQHISRSYVGVLMLTFAWLGSMMSTASAAEIERPNIVLIIADNQSAELVGAYGNKHILTPNIDKLAAEGILFERAFSVSGTCSPSRASMLTGLLPSQTGVHMALHVPVDIPNWSAIEEFRNLPQTLHDAGYRTGLIGKYHLGNAESPQLKFERWITFAGGHTTTFYGQEVIDQGRTYKVEDHLTDFWTDKAVEFIKAEPDDRPFFLMLAYNGPYMLPPTVTMEPRNRYADYYKVHTPPFPQEPVHPYLQNWARIIEPSSQNRAKSTTAWAAIAALNNRTAIINAASETTLVDAGVGRIMDTIAAQNLDKDTLLIYTSDQGSAYGQNGLWGNTSWSFPFEVHNIHVHVPLIIRQLGRIKGPRRSNIIINQFDLFPTLLDYIGLGNIEIANSPGRSFSPEILGKEIAWNNPAIFEFVTVRGIRTPKYIYTRNLDEKIDPLLFDIENDPEEHNNVANDPAYRAVVMELGKHLDDFFIQYADPEYDLWNGGTGKGRLLEDSYGSDRLFSERSRSWRPPFVEKAQPFSDN